MRREGKRKNIITNHTVRLHNNKRLCSLRNCIGYTSNKHIKNDKKIRNTNTHVCAVKGFFSKPHEIHFENENYVDDSYYYSIENCCNLRDNLMRFRKVKNKSLSKQKGRNKSIRLSLKN